VKLLLDTHFLQWIVTEPDQIARRERALISRSDIVVSPVSIWEMRIKSEKHDRNRRRLDLPDPVKAMRFIIDNEMNLVPLTGEECATPLDTPMAHHDPFDELLLVHAQCLGARLLTRDEKLIDHPLAISA